MAMRALTVQGSYVGNPKELRELVALALRPDSGITVTGRVDDLRPYLARAAVAVCPLRIGVGIQNKILEAMAMGKAVVTTPLAARALENGAGASSVSVAATPQELASRIVELIADPDESKRLGLNARAYVEAHHDWRRAAQRVGEAYQQAISKAS